MANFVFPPQAFDKTGLATEAKQDDMIVELQDIESDIEASNVILTSIDGKVSLESTQALIEGKVATEVTLAALETKASTETTLSALEVKASTSANQALQLTEATTSNTKLDTVIASLANVESDIDELNARSAGALIPTFFDYVALSYVAAGNGTGEIETAIYKSGGAGGSTVGTLTLAYDGSDRLSTVTKS